MYVRKDKLRNARDFTWVLKPSNIDMRDIQKVKIFG